jgi:hypothetical protein
MERQRNLNKRCEFIFQKIQDLIPLSNKEKEFQKMISEKSKEMTKTNKTIEHYKTFVDKIDKRSKLKNNFEGEFSKDQHSHIEYQLQTSYQLLEDSKNLIQKLNQQLNF